MNTALTLHVIHCANYLNVNIFYVVIKSTFTYFRNTLPTGLLHNFLIHEHALKQLFDSSDDLRSILTEISNHYEGDYDGKFRRRMRSGD